MTDEASYILTEIWKPKPAWLDLSIEDRQRFFADRIGPFIGGMIGHGAQLLGCAINDNTGSERIDYRYMAVWRLPNKASSDHLEAGAKAAGFLEYFDQVNFSGSLITPDAMNTDMIRNSL